MLAGILGIWLFVKQELRTEYPVLNIRLLRDNKVFTFSNAAALVNYSATSAVGFLLSVYLQSVKSLTPQQAGLVLISQPIVMAVFSPFAGRLSDRVEPRIVASAGMALTMLGLVFFIFMGEGTPVFLIAANLVLLGFGFALFSSPNTNAVMGSVEKKFYGVASATLGTMRLTGQMLSMGVTMMVFAVFIGRVRITPAQGRLFISSSRMLFFIFAVLCFAGIFASLARGKVRN